MRSLTWIASLAATVALSACSLQTTAGVDRVAPLSAEATASQASLPFKTVLDDGPGSGRYLEAGDPERAVLNSQAELDAFLQRHPRSQPQAAPFGPTPPMEPLPPTLTGVDFARYQLIAFFDGHVKLGATSRVTAVRPAGQGLVVGTTRWEPPANPNSADDPVGRVHIVALPRQTRPVTFSELVVSNETSTTGGGVSVAGNPVMQPRWKAVPNPEVTRATIEQMAHDQFSGPGVTRLTVETRTVAWLADNLGPDVGKGLPYTGDSEVWVITAEGDLPFSGPGVAGPIGGQVGAAEPRASRSVQILSIEDGMVSESVITPIKTDPGLHFELLPRDPVYQGDRLHFEVSGKAPEGSLTMSIQVGEQGQPFVRVIPYTSLATFQLALDPAVIPALADTAVQRLTVTLRYGNGEERHTIDLLRDRDTQFTPPLRAVGPTDNPGLYGPSAGLAPLDAFARDIAETDWKGENLSLTSEVVSRASLNLPSPQWDQMPASVGLRKYTLRGQFPKFLIPDVVTSSGRPEVFAPKRLEVVLSDSAPIHVVSTKAFPN